MSHDETNGHTLSFRLLTGIWLGLMVLTGVTIYAASLDFGFLNVVIAMSIATTKALLVVLFFMHLKYENRMMQSFVFIAFFILAIFIGFTFFDTAYR